MTLKEVLFRIHLPFIKNQTPAKQTTLSSPASIGQRSFNPKIQFTKKKTHMAKKNHHGLKIVRIKVTTKGKSWERILVSKVILGFVDWDQHLMEKISALFIEMTKSLLTKIRIKIIK